MVTHFRGIKLRAGFALVAAIVACSCSRATDQDSGVSAFPLDETQNQISSGEIAPPEPAKVSEQSDRQSEIMPDSSWSKTFQDAVERGLPSGGLLLVVDVADQTASLFSQHSFLRSYTISTSAFGTGSEAGSNKTPLGWHRVSDRFGENAVPGTMFVSRRPNGRVLTPEQWQAPDPAEDAVLTRILWLEGLEEGLNRGRGIDSHARCIYLHGTNQEQKLGSPASHGCIRFSNSDIEELFLVATGTELYCLIR